MPALLAPEPRRYRLSFAVEFNAVDDVDANRTAYGTAQSVATQLAQFRADVCGDPEYDTAKLQRLHEHAPPRLVRWYTDALPSPLKCEWEGCTNEALCASGN